MVCTCHATSLNNLNIVVKNIALPQRRQVYILCANFVAVIFGTSLWKPSSTLTTMLVLITLCVLALAACGDAGTCAECKTAYAGASKSDDPEKCTAIKEYLKCLELAETSATVLCTLSQTDAASIATDKAAITCVLTGGCQCQYDLFTTDLTVDDATHCAAVTKRITCLKGETASSCDAAVTVATLAGNSETRAGKITSCPITSACACELTHAKADISDNTKKCTGNLVEINCLMGKTTAGCDPTKSVKDIAALLDTSITTLSCTKTDTCDCEIARTKGTVTTNPNKCTEEKALIVCLKGKTDAGCAGTAVTAIATNTQSAITALTTDCAITTTVCYCDVMYAKSDISSDALKCTALKNEISCLFGKTGTGCDGSTTLIQSATARETAINGISTCTKTDTCVCEISYLKATLTANSDKCTAAKTLTTCMRDTVAVGCGSSTKKEDIGDAISTIITTLGSTECALSTPCSCSVAFNADDIDDNTKKCTSSTKYKKCLTDIGLTSTLKGCDGTVTVDQLNTAHINAKICVAGGVSGMMASLALITAAIAVVMM